MTAADCRHDGCRHDEVALKLWNEMKAKSVSPRDWFLEDDLEPLENGMARSVIQIRIDPASKKRWQKKSAESGMPLSEWIRQAVNVFCFDEDLHEFLKTPTKPGVPPPGTPGEISL